MLDSFSSPGRRTVRPHRHPAGPPMLLKKGAPLGPEHDVVPRLEDEQEFSRIRCPLCGWQPSPSSRWSCWGPDPAQPSFSGCGTVWNTFATRGVCPGCSHRWGWTKCIACDNWSPHEDWYGHR